MGQTSERHAARKESVFCVSPSSSAAAPVPRAPAPHEERADALFARRVAPVPPLLRSSTSTSTSVGTGGTGDESPRPLLIRLRDRLAEFVEPREGRMAEEARRGGPNGPGSAIRRFAAAAQRAERTAAAAAHCAARRIDDAVTDMREEVEALRVEAVERARITERYVEVRDEAQRLRADAAELAVVLDTVTELMGGVWARLSDEQKSAVRRRAEALIEKDEEERREARQ